MEGIISHDAPERQLEHYFKAIRAAFDERSLRRGINVKDLDPIDLLRALVGVPNVATGPDWQQSARRPVDILIAGSRPTK